VSETRTRLLTKAREVFAREGYHGASIRTITREAGVNLGAVTYHFGSKQALYHAVLEEILTPLSARVSAVCEDSGSARARIREVLRAVFEHLWSNPDQARFMVELRLGHVELTDEIMELMMPVSQALVGLIQEGQREGVVREGAPLLFVLSMMAQPVYFMLVTRNTDPALLPADPTTDGGRATYLDHMIEVFLRGVSLPV
jgi:AcrR family transcriptional regulator